MSKSLKKPQKKNSGLISSCKAIFTTTKEVKFEEDMDENDAGKDDQGTKTGSNIEYQDQEPLEAGKRPSSWYERMEQRTEENRKRSINNEKMLSNVDLRTVWIMRLVVGLLVTILGAVIVSGL